MKCLILAAGYATRLYPLTENFPKPLLKVQDKTILDWLVGKLIEKTVRWYLDNQSWLDNVTSGDYLNYYEEMYRNR